MTLVMGRDLLTQLDKERTNMVVPRGTQTARKETCFLCINRGAGIVRWYNAGLVIERSRVRVQAGSIFCADFYFGVRSILVLPQHERSHSAKKNAVSS